jgi:hypothetical protein
MLNKKSFKEKTYNQCLYCDHRGASCYGPRTSDLPIERWREYMRDIKEVEGLTYAAISKRTQEIGIPIPAKTVEKKLSPGGDGQDIMRETARALEIAILGSAPYPCYLAAIEANHGQVKDTPDQSSEVQHLLREIELIHTAYKEELETVRAEAQKKIDYLRAEIEKKEHTIDRLENRIDRILDK